MKAWPERATTDPLLIWSWWSRRPDANIGTPTGLAFDVIDLDGPMARAELERLCDMNHVSLHTPIAKTGRPEGGWQIFIAPTGMGNRKPSPKGIDFRGRGGFVILPPSIHASGNVYTWLIKPSSFQVVPDRLRAALWPPRDRGQVVSTPPQAPRDPSRDEAWAWAALQGLVEELVGAIPGSRNETLNRVAFRAFQLVPHLLREEDVETALRSGCEANGLLADDGPTRVDGTIRSAKAAGMAQPRFPGGTP